MPRQPTLSFHRGTLLLHPPPRGKAWVDYATWDDRVEKFRIPAHQYRPLVETLRAEGIHFTDAARAFEPLELQASLRLEPYPHQREALYAWKLADRQGVIVLPTAAGKTYLAQLAMQATPRSTLILVPTLDLLHQWFAQLEAAFPGVEVGVLGGGSQDRTPILVATYNSAAIHAETLGNRYGLLVFDECHHLPTEFFRVIAEFAIAPYRLGLTATPERTDGSHADLETLIGPVVYRKSPQDLSGQALAEHQVVQIKVQLSELERQRYDRALQTRNDFLQQAKISLGSLQGWQHFVQASARSPAGRRAMLAHREAKAIALGTDGKLRLLAELVAKHYPERLLIFTNDNATVYRISQDFLLPAITHQTPVKERHTILDRFRSGEYRALVASHVLNEGVDVPDARVAIILSGTGSTREYVQRLGRVLRKGSGANKLAILYEVVAEDTTEERTSARRHGSTPNQLELLPQSPLYGKGSGTLPSAAESANAWDHDSE
ncbi:MAG: DEAD/DEAH box helicase [Spirulinaceae cyanobacterium SM2_1_0]|nr:DEAD/DEAH box helicase [Spirulinaceae cyanobacterium SM2_1_0]